MDKFNSLIFTILVFEALENSYSTYHGNIYGIKRLVGNKTNHSVHQHYWFKRHHVHLRQKYPKTLVFSTIATHECTKTKTYKNIIVKRIGGNYPYGPKQASTSKTKICSPNIAASYSHPSSISFSTSRLKSPKKALAASINQFFLSKRKKSWNRNKAWCAHCESYWKMKIFSKELKSRHGCC